MTYCTRKQAEKIISDLLKITKGGMVLTLSSLNNYERTIMYALLEKKYVVMSGIPDLPPYTYTWNGRYPDQKDIDYIYGFLDMPVMERGILNFKKFLTDTAGTKETVPAAEPVQVKVRENSSGDGFPEALRAYSPTEIWDELKTRGFKPEGNAIFRIVQLS